MMAAVMVVMVISCSFFLCLFFFFILFYDCITCLCFFFVFKNSLLNCSTHSKTVTIFIIMALDSSNFIMSPVIATVFMFAMPINSNINRTRSIIDYMEIICIFKWQIPIIKWQKESWVIKFVSYSFTKTKCIFFEK